MGRKWDDLSTRGATTTWHEAWLTEAHRVLEPGGVIKVFSATRTFHRLAAAMKGLGFQDIRLEVWAYGSGFPKSLNISKALDKMAGAERAKVRVPAAQVRNPKSINGGVDIEGGDRPWMRNAREEGFHELDDDTAITDEAKKWAGWGTALKPAWEPILVGRKP